MSLIRKFLNWFTGKNDKEQLKELKEVLPEKPLFKAPPPPPIKKGTLEDIRDYCEEVRKTLTIYKKSCEQMRDASWVHKKAIDSLYVEWGNLADKIDRLIESQKGEDDV